MSRIALTAALGLVLVVSGCATQPPTSTTSSPTPSVASTTPSSPVVEVPAVLSTEGYGNVHIGQAVPEPVGPELLEWNAQACEGYGAWQQTGLPAGTEGTYVQDGVSLVVDSAGSESAPLTAIVVISEGGPVSDTGIGVGSSEADLLAAYESFDAVIDSQNGSLIYVVNGTAGRLQFVVAESSVSHFGVTAGSVDDPQTRLGATDWYFPCS
jgi:hypothetical protein